MFPLAVVLFIVMCAYAFFVLEVSHHIARLDKVRDDDNFEWLGAPTATDYLNWAFYVLWLLMTVWAFLKMVFSCPGYVPLQYEYEQARMTARDRFILNYLMLALSTTMCQQVEAIENGQYVRGSIRQTQTSERLFQQLQQLSRSFLPYLTQSSSIRGSAANNNRGNRAMT